MRSIITFTLLLVKALITYGQTTDVSPTIEKVVTEFYKSYSVKFLDKYITFEKKKNDWYVVYNDVHNKDFVPEQKKLFYDGKAQKFQTLQLEENRENKEINVYDYLSDYAVRNFNLQPYYGYEGWYKDVIKEYENKPKLSDDELYCLARAYSSNYMNLVSDHDGFAVKKEIWNLPFSMNCLNNEQLAQFEKASNKAINCFKNLAERNPSYETVVGKIGMKYANEVMVKYNILLAYANNYAQKMILPTDLYTEEQLATPRKYLEDCPSNAIFCSYSDNEHYPVEYLQKAKAIRKDVCLINITLLGIDRYIYRYTFPQFEASSIVLSVDTSFYLDSKSEIIYRVDSSGIFDISSLRSFLQNIKNDVPGILHANRIRLTVSTVDNGNTESKIKLVLPVENAKYLLRNQWIFLDMLENLNGRKICFPGLLQYEEPLQGLNNYLTPKGSVWIFKY